MLTLTDEQLYTLRHMLGINTPDEAKPEPYRDYYCAYPGDPKLTQLAEIGAVRLYSTRGRYDWYCCTDAGREAAIRSHRTIRNTKSQRVYSSFLSARDVYPDLTFKAFLTDEYFRDARRNA